MFQTIFTAQRLYNSHNNIKSALPEVTGPHTPDRHTHTHSRLSDTSRPTQTHTQHCFQATDARGSDQVLFSISPQSPASATEIGRVRYGPKGMFVFNMKLAVYEADLYRSSSGVCVCVRELHMADAQLMRISGERQLAGPERWSFLWAPAF